MAAVKRVFTPISVESGRRVNLRITPEEASKIERGHRWQKMIKVGKKKYKVKGCSCGIAGCYCDAEIYGYKGKIKKIS